MTGYLVRRAFGGLLVLWLLSGAVFVLAYFVAPDPVRVIGGPHATPETLALVRRDLGLDEPIAVQYGRYARRLLQGDLGHSYINGAPVRSLLAGALPTSLLLLAGGAVLWLAGGLAAGVLAAVRPALDRAMTLLMLLGLSVPSFVLGLLLLQVFFRPVLGVRLVEPGPPLEEHFWQRMALPWLTLALLQLATYARLTRGALLDALDQDFVRTARAKGLAEPRVVLRHGLRAALTPVVSQLGVDLGTLVGGAVVTEQVFGLQGAGQLAVRAVTTGDTPVILGLTLLTALAVVAAGLTADLAYAMVDPRIRLR